MISYLKSPMANCLPRPGKTHAGLRSGGGNNLAASCCCEVLCQSCQTLSTPLLCHNPGFARKIRRRGKCCGTCGAGHAHRARMQRCTAAPPVNCSASVVKTKTEKNLKKMGESPATIKSISRRQKDPSLVTSCNSELIWIQPFKQKI